MNTEFTSKRPETTYSLVSDLRRKTYNLLMELLRPLKDSNLRGFQILDGYEEMTEIPQRGTSKSAGYDIKAVGDYVVQPNETVEIDTGLTAYMQDDEWLAIVMRSGLAKKHTLTMQNDVAVIDADFYGKQFKVLLRNEGTENFYIQHGDRIAQGVFVNYLVTDDDQPMKQYRTGGFGSTGVQ